ncbi:type II secretion system secretin GspD [Halobacteriovorax sp. HLS]|uniref:type II secretion system secretin GspD n=1 Tax=Halobacteriovorax sp. HLS TaxID=2234000 RepID=UPI000FD9A6BF|nr:type II secretion system secretin GspD [Halobacteriovorax sp. HLS]
MKNATMTVSTFLTIALMATAPAQVMAQFKPGKFKSKTKYNTSNKSATSLIKTKDGSSDFFGRSSDSSEIDASKDKKYVNLNPETAFGPEVITSFDFPDTSLTDLTKHMQKLTGINLILDKDLKGKVSIMAPTAITVGDAWKAYLTALNLNGYTLVKSGSFYKIVNARDIRYTPTKIYTGNFTPNTDNYVMRILPLKNINSTEVTRSFRPFMSRYGRIIDIKQTNTIIVQDTGANINRLTRLIKFIDVPGHEESLQIMPVKNSSAQEIAKLLDQIFKGTKSNSKVRTSSSKSTLVSDIKLIAEPRTNSIIAMTNAEGAKQLSALIAKLDVKLVNSSSGQIHVYYLNHGTSETLAKTLSSLVSSAKPATTSKSRFSKLSSSSDSSTLFNAEVKITSDKENNAIVVTASPTDYLTIKEVIKKLDRPRDQVFVEGMIMETSVTKDQGFGVNIIGAYGSGATDKAGFIGNGGDLFNVMTNNITALGGLFVGGGTGATVTQNVGGTEVKIKSVSGLITAIAANAGTNVLATPQIMALDNEEAIFEVGESIPTAERTNAANGSSSTSIKQQKVALTLKITPQVNKVTRFIKLKIDQKIDDFSNRSLPSSVQSEGVATTTRSAITSVVVRDRDTIAMGGLMRDKEADITSKVPLLGDIPVLGWLFKNTKKSVEKVNLLFFLTPKIIDVYNTANAKNVQDQLNRRSTHLKNALGEKDPFASTAKGLYDKAKRQEEGPLYDEEEAGKYRRENEGPGIGDDKKKMEDPLLGDSEQVPNYNVIVQKVKSKASATQK